MPRRKIGADLKEALCKLYEAGDLSADTIEKHGIMSRATFFRNLKMWKAGGSLEQRHSTGRKSNADKRREEEQQEVDRLQPLSLKQLQLSLLEDVGASTSRLPPSDKALGKAKQQDPPPWDAELADERARSVSAEADDEEGDSDADPYGPSEEQRYRQSQQARDFCLRMIKQAYGFDYTPAWHDDLDSLLDPDGNQYSARHRGAFWVVRQFDESGPIVATVGLRSFIWKPQLYQSLGARYASKSIDKVGYLGRLYVDPIWRRRGIGRWLTSVAELKASKLGFTTMYLHATSSTQGTLAFWRAMAYTDFIEIDGNTHFDRPIIPNVPPPLKERRKRPTHLSTSSTSLTSKSRRPRQGLALHRSNVQSSPSSSRPPGTSRSNQNSSVERRSPLSVRSIARENLAVERPILAESSLVSRGIMPTFGPSPNRPNPGGVRLLEPQSAVVSADAPAVTAAAAAAVPSISSRAAVSLPPPPRKIMFHEAVSQGQVHPFIRTTAASPVVPAQTGSSRAKAGKQQPQKR